MRLIDADALKDAISKPWMDKAQTLSDVLNIINATPSVEGEAVAEHEFLISIHSSAVGGLCAMSHSGCREFLKDIRRDIEKFMPEEKTLIRESK